MENKTAKEVVAKAVDKKEVKKFDYKAVAESFEAAFKNDARVTVIADTKLEIPKSNTYSEYTYIHFFKSGTQKDMFGCYLIGKGRTRFALSLAVAEYIKGLPVQPVEKKIKGEKKLVAIDVICANEDAVNVANTIIEAYANIPVKPKKEKKVAEKSEPKQSPEPKKEKKPATSKKTTVAKRPAKAAEKKAVNK